MSLRIKGIGLGLFVAAATQLWVSAALAGVPSTMRLNGSFPLQDQTEGAENQACVNAEIPNLYVFGEVVGTTGDCTVTISYIAAVLNKASASVLKDDGSGKAAVSQQVETLLEVDIVGAECATAPYGGDVAPEKCKTSASVNASEPSQAVDKGKVSVSCEIGPDGSQLSPSPTTAQLQTIADAFADRNDVKLTNTSSKGKVAIKLNGEQGNPLFCD
jgi:hypothetical protein